MEKYEIWKNKRLFASFEQGDLSRFGTPFNQEIAVQEFNSCVSYWVLKGVKAEWELRICKRMKKWNL